MDIRWLAEGCLELRAAGALVIVDPPPAPSPGLADIVARANWVAVSRRALLPGGTRTQRWLDGPGEFERSGVFVIGVRTLPARLGNVDEAELNTAYVFGADDVSVCCLGAIDHVPGEAELEALGRIDVLVVPIGAAGRLGPGKAAEIVGRLEPAVVIPIHAALPADDPPEVEREALAHFLAAMGVPEPAPLDSYRVAVEREAGETTVVVLRPVHP